MSLISDDDSECRSDQRDEGLNSLAITESITHRKLKCLGQ